MVSEFLDINLPLFILSIVVGYQITGYFIYNYYKVKDEKLDLNMILLAYGLLYGLGLTGIAIRYIYFFLGENELSSEIFISFSHLFIFLATFSFLLILSKKCFNEIINVKISKVIAIITLIISILLFFIKSILIRGIVILIAAIIGAVYMVSFHLRLIHLSTGAIKKRIYFLFFGEIILIGGIIIFSRENQLFFPLQIQQIMQLLFNISIFLGLIIIFFGVFKIPIFLEFHWKENLISFYVIDAVKLNSIYSYNFINIEKNVNDSLNKGLDQERFNFLFPKGIIGIQRITSLISDKDLNNKIKKIEKGDFTLLLRYGENTLSFIIYCLVVKKEMTSINYFFKLLQNNFENFYKYILQNLINLNLTVEEKIKFFLAFDNNIKEILS